MGIGTGILDLNRSLISFTANTTIITIIDVTRSAIFVFVIFLKTPSKVCKAKSTLITQKFMYYKMYVLSAYCRSFHNIHFRKKSANVSLLHFTVDIKGEILDTDKYHMVILMTKLEY